MILLVRVDCWGSEKASRSPGSYRDTLTTYVLFSQGAEMCASLPIIKSIETRLIYITSHWAPFATLSPQDKTFGEQIIK